MDNIDLGFRVTLSGMQTSGEIVQFFLPLTKFIPDYFFLRQLFFPDNYLSIFQTILHDFPR